MDALNLQGILEEDRRQFLEAAYERCTRIIENGPPEEVPGAYLIRGRVSLMRKDYDAAAQDFAAAKVSEGLVMFAAARELTLIERYKAGDELVPGIATGSEILAQYLAKIKADQYSSSPTYFAQSYRRALESWGQWCETHGLDLLRVSAEDFVPWLAAQTFHSHAERIQALEHVLMFYSTELARRGYIACSPLHRDWAPHVANLAVQMVGNHRADMDQQGASL